MRYCSDGHHVHIRHYSSISKHRSIAGWRSQCWALPEELFILGERLADKRKIAQGEVMGADQY